MHEKMLKPFPIYYATYTKKKYPSEHAIVDDFFGGALCYATYILTNIYIYTVIKYNKTHVFLW